MPPRAEPESDPLRSWGKPVPLGVWLSTALVGWRRRRSRLDNGGSPRQSLVGANPGNGSAETSLLDQRHLVAGLIEDNGVHERLHEQKAAAAGAQQIVGSMGRPTLEVSNPEPSSGTTNRERSGS